MGSSFSLVASVTFTILAGVGVCLRGYALREARHDRRYVTSQLPDDAAALTIVGTAIRTETLGILIKIILMTIGIASVSTRQPHQDPLIFFRVYAFFAMSIIVILMNINSYLWLVTRRSLIANHWDTQS